MTHIEPSIWAKLGEDRPSGDNLTARLAVPQTTERLLCAINTEKRRHLLIPLDDGDKPIVDSRSRGLVVTTEERIIRGRKSTRYVDIECQDIAGYPAFDLIGSELAIALATSSDSPSEIVSRVLGKWRRFWSQVPRPILSMGEQLGLFAELWFLSTWLLPRLGPAAVQLWRGPFGSRHDFEWPDKSVEVKATKARPRVHHINGYDQLEPPQNGPLYLFSVRVREEAGATNHLPILVENCLQQLAHDPAVQGQFEEALHLAGYLPLYVEDYARLRLRIVDEAMFIVRDNFPRLLTTSFTNGLPAGIERVEYQINLNGFEGLIVAKKPEDWKC